MTISKSTPGPWYEWENDGVRGVGKKHSSEADILHAVSESSRPLEEDAANMRLCACAPALRDALVEAAQVLRKYEILHWAKETPESDAKAKVNGDLAAKFEALIIRANGESK